LLLIQEGGYAVTYTAFCAYGVLEGEASSTGSVVLLRSPVKRIGKKWPSL